MQYLFFVVQIYNIVDGQNPRIQRDQTLLTPQVLRINNLRAGYAPLDGTSIGTNSP